MSIPQKKLQEPTINSYLPAVLKENKSGWIIEYYVAHPETKKLTRKQVRLQRILSRYKSIREARLHINRMINVINAKLAGGWNPFFEGEDSRMYTRFNDVAELFLIEKKKELRKNTIRSYSSFLSILKKWVQSNHPDMYFSLFNQQFTVRYMDYLYSKNTVGITTYNNHIKLGRALFNWAKERCYTKQNPFELIKPKPKTKKQRIIIPSEVRAKIIEDLQINNTNFLLICKLVFNSLIRPNEINNLQVKHLRLNDRYILIPAEVAKNHKSRAATVTQDIIDDFRKMCYENYPDNYYLFGSNLIPAKVPSGYRRYWQEWRKVCKRLNLPAEMQLYSLRDTGIFDMLKSGIDDLSVMQHADHSSLEMTTLYGNHADPNLINLIYTKSPKF